MRTLRLLTTLPLLLGSVTDVKSQDIASAFCDPPDSARVHVWWHWMNGNVSKEGITKDLECVLFNKVVTQG